MQTHTHTHTHTHTNTQLTNAAVEAERALRLDNSLNGVQGRVIVLALELHAPPDSV